MNVKYDFSLQIGYIGSLKLIKIFSILFHDQPPVLLTCKYSHAPHNDVSVNDGLHT